MHDGVAGVGDVDINIRVVGTSREVPGRTYEREPLLSTVVHKMHARRLAQSVRAECIETPMDVYNTDRAYECCTLQKNRYNRLKIVKKTRIRTRDTTQYTLRCY